LAIKRSEIRPDMVAHAFNSSFSRGRDQSKVVQGQYRQKVSKTPISTISCVVVTSSSPSYMGGGGRRMAVQIDKGKNMRTFPNK
jgi:hypothetical protein